MQGQTDVPLDDLGRAQAAQAASLLAEYRPDLVASSDLVRAAETAGLLASVCGLTVRSDRRLRERDFGPWQGRTLAEIEAGWPAEFRHWQRGEPVGVPGVESAEMLAARVAAALIGLSTGSGTTVVVSHGSALRLGMAALLGWPEKVAYTVYGLENCHWVELREVSGRWRLAGYNQGAGTSAAPIDATVVGVEERPESEGVAADSLYPRDSGSGGQDVDGVRRRDHGSAAHGDRMAVDQR